MSNKFSRNSSRVQPTPKVCKKAPIIPVVPGYHVDFWVDPDEQPPSHPSWAVAIGCAAHLGLNTPVSMLPIANLPGWEYANDGRNCNEAAEASFIFPEEPGHYVARIKCVFADSSFRIAEYTYNVIDDNPDPPPE